MDEVISELLRLLNTEKVDGVSATNGNTGAPSTELLRALQTLAGVRGQGESPVVQPSPVLAAEQEALRLTGGGRAETDSSVTRLTSQLDLLRQAALNQVESLTANTDALATNTASQAGRGAQAALGAAGKMASGLLQGSGIGLLVSGIRSLFGSGSRQEEVPTLQQYAAPAPQRIESAITASQRTGLHSFDYMQGELPRVANSQQPANQPSININVQAIDSRSFMDHSDAIARAVREAMLNSHALNDVINEI